MSTTKNANSLVASAWIALAIGSTVPIAAIAQIEEVVVTTRKREENLQDIPLAVSAITAEQIQRQGINSLSDVVASQPSVQFDQSYGPADNRITVRGPLCRWSALQGQCWVGSSEPDITTRTSLIHWTGRPTRILTRPAAGPLLLTLS